MIRATWRAPNWRCQATDLDEKERRWITWAPTEAALRKRIEERGWTVLSIVPYDFADWLGRAQEAFDATEQAYRSTGEPTFKPKLWGDLKTHLFELFHGKCAYCEAKVQHVDHGAVEHYRPKKAVTEDPSHPGYYWLAYDVQNLLPACGLCNEGGGKMNQFPLEGGTHARDAAAVVDERPMLLHPYRDDPRKHLQFLPKGMVKGKTPRGGETIRICRLRRLRDERIAAQERVAEDVWARARDQQTFFDACVERVQALLRGEEEYSAAQIDHLLHLIAEEHRRAQEANAALGDLLG